MIKIGETYNVRMKVTDITKNFVYVKIDATDTSYDYMIPIDKSEVFSEISRQNGTKNTEPAPKYDPCRRFRKRDIVEVKEDIDGRNLHAFTTGLTLGKLYTVEEDEKDCKLKIKNDDGYGIYAFVHFKLVTPVEEIEPYEVECDDDDKEYSVTIRGKILCTYPYDSDSFYTKEQAKAAAESERDRLNAEY